MPLSDRIVIEHKAEVDRRSRFEFGKNWQRFLGQVDDARIARAQKSLQDFLGRDRLDGLTFLDVGSGSGLFSLAARRLGAKVRSFDYDTHSVACTKELRQRYMPADPDWAIDQGSALDESFLAGLGQFDIVYAWGVLHHTGQMWKALDLVKGLVRAGGVLYIAIYNDLGTVTDRWHRVKVRYNSLPASLKLPYAASILAFEEWPQVKHYLRRGNPWGYVCRWRNYQSDSTRGMSFWRDQVDWIGGLPYERATLDEAVNFFLKDDFELANIASRANGYGCNEFLFRRVYARGESLDHRLKCSGRLVRRAGYPLTDVTERDGYWYGQLIERLPTAPTEILLLLNGNTLLGEVQADVTEIEGVKSVRWPRAVHSDGRALHIVSAKRRVLKPPFRNTRGRMWEASLADLEHTADSIEGSNSTLTLFHGAMELPYAHASHADIAKYGEGRYSHWLGRLYFALPDNSNPNTATEPIVILYHDELASERSSAPSKRSTSENARNT